MSAPEPPPDVPDERASRRRASLVLGVTIAIAAAALGFRALQPDRFDALSLPLGGDFTLQSADGPFELRSLRGEVVLVYFGYTYCPDVCPTSLSAISLALRALAPEELSQVRVVFVSVDPERDPPRRAAEYAAAFHPRMIGVTGTLPELTAIAARYGAHFEKQQVDSAAGYLVDHSSATFVVNREGRLVALVRHGSAPDAIAGTLRRALAP